MDKAEIKLPKNWKNKKLGELCSIVYGKGLLTRNLKENGFPVFGANGIIGFNDKYLYEETKVLISCRGAYSGKINFSPPKCFITNNSLVLTVKNTNDLDKTYLFYSLGASKKTKLVTGTAQPQVTINNAIELDIPLPPLATQQSIVSKIEELFSELDNGIANLKTAQQQIKNYRQAVLKWAFEGKLTNKNVKEGELPKGWKKVELKDVVALSPEKHKPIKEENLFYVGLEHIEKHTGKLTSKVGVEHITTIKNKFYKDDLLYGKLRPNLNKCYLAKEEGVCSTDILVLKLASQCLGKFLHPIMLSTGFVNEMSENTSGVNLPRVSTKFILEYKIPLPSVEEQDRIIQEIESRLSIADKMEESINQSLQQAEALRQSILKKAFEGKLI